MPKKIKPNQATLPLSITDNVLPSDYINVVVACGTIFKELKNRVRRGAEYLDSTYTNPYLEEQGLGWVDLVCPSTLDLNSGSYCVFGQVFGDFARHLESIDKSNKWAMRHGFLAGDESEYNGDRGVDDDDYEWQVAILDILWVTEVEKRKAARTHTLDLAEVNDIF